MTSINKKTIEDVSVSGKKVLVRCDFNVPLSGGAITNDTRIVEALPTIKYLAGKGAKVILCSHLGRPEGKGVEPDFSLSQVVRRLSELLGQKVLMAADVIGSDAKAKSAALEPGQIMLLENVRFHKEETKNNPDFSKELASLAELYVNDAFGTAHRAHSSTAGVADFLPAVSGYLIQKEVSVIGGALQTPKRPFVAILGGAKVSDKIGVIENLLGKVDTLIIGGGMAYTFFKAQDHNIGASICENDKLEMARDILKKAEEKGVKLLLPCDNVIADKFAADASTQEVEADKFPEGWMGMDIGSKARELFAKAIIGAGTVIWNGPMGVFEMDRFAVGTNAVAKAVAESGSMSIVGGGDSVAAVSKLGYSEKMGHISTGGGATLEFLEGLELPGIACLEDK